MYNHIYFDELVKYLREIFVDKDRTRQELVEMISTTFEDPSLSEESLKIAEEFKPITIECALEGIDVIFEQAESPIEKIFFNSVNMLAALGLLPLFFKRPFTLSKEYLDEKDERIARGRALFDWYHQKNEPSHSNFMKWVEDTGDYTDEYMNFLGTWYRYRWSSANRIIYIQPEISDVFPYSDFPLRADALVIAFDGTYRLVVECDGFEYHKEKPTFTRDRQKDRFLKAKGFEVLRFTGSEIHADPIECAKQLLRYIYPDPKYQKIFP